MKSHFRFDGQNYNQIDGVAMGLPLGPVLANIFMCHFEEKWVISGQVCPSFWYRYVDDTFTMFENKDTANGFLQYLNSHHNSIKFTIEFEQDNEIPFLDILVKRCPDNTFVTSIYRKKTFTGLYTKWDLFTPRKYKLNLICTLTYRCYVNDVLNKNRNKPRSPVSTAPKKDIIILLPYLGLQSNQISQRLKSCVYNFYSFVNLKIIFQNNCRIKSFFPYKDRLNRSQKSKVIYKASCWECNDFYIGETKQQLRDRKTEHFKALVKNDHKSVIADHVKTTGHNIKWDHFDILASGKTDYHCKIKETLLIKELKPAFNVNISSEKLMPYSLALAFFS